MNPSNGFVLQEKIASLSEAILHKHPTLPILLQEIHKTLKLQPENVTLLSEEEIQIIVKGLEIQTGFELASSVTKASATKSISAKIKTLGADAF